MAILQAPSRGRPRRLAARAATAGGWVLLALLLVYVHALLLGNPGYFSHDELQWGARAAVADWRALPWQDFTDLARFQYRPLTFDLWLLLSHALFDTPRAMHAAWVLMGACNAALLVLVLRRLGCARALSLAAGGLFLLTPYAVYVHGWVATLADLLWAAFGLCVALLALSQPRAPGTRQGVLLALGTAALTTLALLSKEAALSIPALLVVAWAVTRDRRWAWALTGAAVVAVVYLALRLDVLLSGAEPGTGYGVSAWRVPQRFVQYHLFTIYPWMMEINPLFHSHHERLTAIGLICASAYALAFRRLAALGWFLLASAAALGPVLVLDSASDQYGYGLALLLAAALALAWRSAGRWGRGAVLVLAVFSSWHGARVAQGMVRVGEIQGRFSPSLVAAVQAKAATVSMPLLLQIECEQDRWVYRRLTHQVPSYRGIALGERVQLTQRDAVPSAAATVGCDGKVRLND